MPFFRRKKEPKEPKSLQQLIEERETREGKARPLPFVPLYIIGGLTIFIIFISSCGLAVFFFVGPELGEEEPLPTAVAGIPEEFLIRGIAFAEEGQFDLAIRDFTEAIYMRPDYSSAFYNRGLTYTRLEQYEDGIRDFTTAISIVPEHQGAHFWRAMSYTLLGRDSEAEVDVTRAIELGVDADELRARIEGAKLSRETTTATP